MHHRRNRSRIILFFCRSIACLFVLRCSSRHKASVKQLQSMHSKRAIRHSFDENLCVCCSESNYSRFNQLAANNITWWQTPGIECFYNEMKHVALQADSSVAFSAVIDLLVHAHCHTERFICRSTHNWGKLPLYLHFVLFVFFFVIFNDEFLSETNLPLTTTTAVAAAVASFFILFHLFCLLFIEPGDLFISRSCSTHKSTFCVRLWRKCVNRNAEQVRK